jgi:hypothetical protein
MMPDPLFYQRLLVGLVWLCLMLHVVWPYDCATAGPTTPRPAKAPPKRSRDPQPFPGLTHKPHCEACAQAAVLRPQAPCAPPPRIVSTRGRPRQVDTSSHFCPQPPCAYRGWVGLGNSSANGHPNGGRIVKIFELAFLLEVTPPIIATLRDRLRPQLIELTIFALTLLGPSGGVATNLSWASATRAARTDSALCACPRERHDNSSTSA